jgi:flagellar biosynthesis/type III secretory pathway protein FliH
LEGRCSDSAQQLTRQVLLNYLPLDRAQWQDALAKNRALYQEFKIELIVNPRKDYATSTASQPQHVEDHVSNWRAVLGLTRVIAPLAQARQSVEHVLQRQRHDRGH